MMSATPLICLFILVCSLSSGQTIRPYSQLLKSSNLSMTKNMCSDCTKIMELISNMLSRKETQDLLQEYLNGFCRRLPGIKPANDCLEFVEKYLPSVIKALIAFTTYKEGEICMVLGLCATEPQSKTPQLLNVGLDTNTFVQLQPSTGTSHEFQVTPQCTFCLFLIKKLENMLPKERTEESVVKLLEKICDILPDHFKEQCNSFLDKYGKQLIDFLLTSATPHTICTLLHLCLLQETPAMVPSLPSDCKTCKNLVILSQIYLGQNASASEMSPFLHNMCYLHPDSLPGCEPFIQSHEMTLVMILGKREEAVNACQKLFCTGNK